MMNSILEDAIDVHSRTNKAKKASSLRFHSSQDTASKLRIWTKGNHAGGYSPRQWTTVRSYSAHSEAEKYLPVFNPQPICWNVAPSWYGWTS